MRSLVTVAKATKIIKAKGEILIVFTLKENNDHFEAMENENKIINELSEVVETKIKEIECLEIQYEEFCKDKYSSDIYTDTDTYSWGKYYKDELKKLYAYVG